LILETEVAKERLSSILNYGGLPPDAIYFTQSIKTVYNGKGHYELRNEA